MINLKKMVFYFKSRWYYIGIMLFVVILIVYLNLFFKTHDTKQSNWLDYANPSPEWLLQKLNLPPLVRISAYVAKKDQKKFDKILWDYFSNRPELQGLPLNFMSHAGAVEEFEKGKITIKSYPSINFNPPIDWSIDDYTMTFLAELH